MLCHQGARLFIYIFFSRNDFPVGDSARSNMLCALLPISGPSTPPHSYFGRPRKRLRADFLTSPVIAFLDAVQKTPVAKKEKKKNMETSKRPVEEQLRSHSRFSRQKPNMAPRIHRWMTSDEGARLIDVLIFPACFSPHFICIHSLGESCVSLALCLVLSTLKKSVTSALAQNTLQSQSVPIVRSMTVFSTFFNVGTVSPCV